MYLSLGCVGVVTTKDGKGMATWTGQGIGQVKELESLQTRGK
jgi:hypothetical protein